MQRQTYETLDGTKKWFNVEKAEQFEEATNWNGNNHISVPTGTQWNHECLYHSRKGTWILNAWDQFQGSIESWTKITAKMAAQWLMENNYEVPKGFDIGDYEG